jgi:hypothetical protein
METNKECKHYTEWTRKEFESLPRPKSYTNQEIGEVDCLIILPCRHRHDSGYRCMEFVTIQNNIPTYIVSGCSDVIHLGGIGGLNIYKNDKLANKRTSIIDWSIDCLPTSGLLRLFCSKRIIVGASLSSFEIFVKED